MVFDLILGIVVACGLATCLTILSMFSKNRLLLILMGVLLSLLGGVVMWLLTATSPVYWFVLFLIGSATLMALELGRSS